MQRYPEPPSAPGDEATAELAVKLVERDEEIVRLRAALHGARAVLQMHDRSKAWLAERNRVLERIAQVEL